MSAQPFSRETQSKLQSIVRSNRIDPRVLNAMKRLFYTFDFDKNKTLSLSEVRKGMSYLALEKAGVPPPQTVVDRLFFETVQSRDPSDPTPKNRLTFADFLRLYAINASKKMAAQRAYRT